MAHWGSLQVCHSKFIFKPQQEFTYLGTLGPWPPSKPSSPGFFTTVVWRVGWEQGYLELFSSEVPWRQGNSLLPPSRFGTRT